MTGKEQFREIKYQIEKCSFLLDVIRAHVGVILETDAHSGSMLDACIIMGGVSPQYCDFILKMRERFPDHDLESLSQEIYDRIFSRDYKSTARFQAFFEDYLAQWNIVKNKERELREGLLDKDKTVENFKNAYRINYGTEIEVTEIPKKTTKPEQDDEETVGEFNIRLVREELICQMFKNGDIDEKTALKYIDDPYMCHGLFLKLVDIHTGKEELKEKEEQTAEARNDARLELLFELVQDGTLSAGNAFEYVADAGFDFDTFLRMQEAWEAGKDD